MVLTTAMLCMAINIFHEARGEPLEGQHAVAQVTMNRAGRDPDKVCRVVFEPKRFSWANPLTSASKAERARLAQGFVPKDNKAWEIARSIAFHTINGNIQDFTGGAMFFHTKASKPTWRHDYKLVAVIGQHKFYAIA